jgi:hypothetical protein
VNIAKLPELVRKPTPYQPSGMHLTGDEEPPLHWISAARCVGESASCYESRCGYKQQHQTERNWSLLVANMTVGQAATLKRLAEAAYELEAFQPNLTRAEADLRIAMLTAKLKLLDGPPHTL